LVVPCLYVLIAKTKQAEIDPMAEDDAQKQ
jgi:hypothetical protein